MEVKRRVRLNSDCVVGNKGEIIEVYYKQFLAPYIKMGQGRYHLRGDMYTWIKSHYPNIKIFRELYPEGYEYGEFWVVE